MDEKKIKKIKLTASDGKEYMLAFDRSSCNRLSNIGFTLDDIDEKAVIRIPQLVAGAFLKFHSDMSRAEIDKVWKEVKGKEALLLELAKMYQEPIDSLLEEPKDDEKNATWEVVV